MLKVILVLLALGFSILPGRPCFAGQVFVLGDSIGEGVALAAHVPSLARISVHIRGPRALAQIANTPKGATAVLLLGSNDAAGPPGGLGPHIDHIVRAAAKRGIRLVWVGPHCVRRSWDHHARVLDQYLSKYLQARNVLYVSMRDPALCTSHFYAHDGVHLSMKGYAYIWKKTRAAAGLPASVVQSSAKPSKTAALASSGGSHQAHVRKRSHRRVKRHKGRRASSNASSHQAHVRKRVHHRVKKPKGRKASSMTARRIYAPWPADAGAF